MTILKLLVFLNAIVNWLIITQIDGITTRTIMTDKDPPPLLDPQGPAMKTKLLWILIGVILTQLVRDLITRL